MIVLCIRISGLRNLEARYCYLACANERPKSVRLVVDLQIDFGAESDTAACPIWSLFRRLALRHPLRPIFSFAVPAILMNHLQMEDSRLFLRRYFVRLQPSKLKCAGYSFVGFH